MTTQCAVLESKADLQKGGQASPDDGDALALSLAQPVEPAEVKKRTKKRHSAGSLPASSRGGCDDGTWRVHGQSVAATSESLVNPLTTRQRARQRTG